LADPERRSRGEIVFRALESPTAADAAAAIAGLEATDYNPFHLLLADPEEMHVVVGDGDQLTASSVTTELAVVTERSFGAADNSRKRRLRRRLRQHVDAGELDLDLLRDYMTDCSGGIDAICVNLEEIDYGTRSSTLMRYGGGDVEFWHAEGQPCEVDYEDMSQMAEDVLQQ
ncbi:MAG: NRDE family protein, partial [Bradymonadaceae bacterium]